MEFSNGGTDTRVSLSLTVGKEPDPKLFATSAYAETTPFNQWRQMLHILERKRAAHRVPKSMGLRRFEAKYKTYGLPNIKH